MRKAAALDPLNGRVWSGLGGLLVTAGQMKEGREALNRSLEINPTQASAAAWLGFSLLVEGQPGAAFTEYQRSTSDVFRLMGTALTQHTLGQAAASQRALDALIAGYGPSGAYQVAIVYAWRGDHARALDWLERAYAQRDGGLMLLKLDPTMDKLRDDPRYLALMRKLNLPPG